MEFNEVAKTFKLPVLIRYFYSGFLAVGLLQLTPAKQAVNTALESLGGVLATLLVFFGGIFIWTVYHQVIGEFLIFRLIHLIHERISPDTCDIVLLRECGVPKARTRHAYAMIRAMYFQNEVRDWVEIEHAHHQLLDITWLEILGLIIAFGAFEGVLITGWLTLLITALVCAVAAAVADIRQHSIERLLMLGKGKQHLIEWLREVGVID